MPQKARPVPVVGGTVARPSRSCVGDERRMTETVMPQKARPVPIVGGTVAGPSRSCEGGERRMTETVMPQKARPVPPETARETATGLVTCPTGTAGKRRRGRKPAPTGTAGDGDRRAACPTGTAGRAYNLGNFLRLFVPPMEIARWSLTTLRGEIEGASGSNGERMLRMDGRSAPKGTRSSLVWGIAG